MFALARHVWLHGLVNLTATVELLTVRSLEVGCVSYAGRSDVHNTDMIISWY